MIILILRTSTSS